jgi:hypothetical protein
MAAAYIQEPGTKYGPCAIDCGHIDCASLRKIADSNCVLCHAVIGYTNGYFTDNDDRGYVHALCLEDECEREQLKERKN